METKIKTLQELIDNASRIVFFGGAGVSTASGIPDFRSSQGLFLQETGYKVPAEEILSIQFFNQQPKIFFDFYFENLVHQDAKPNLVHYYIAELEKRNKHVAVVTQNIDGLHELAGSSHIYNLHGSIAHNYCESCGRHFSLDELSVNSEGIPRCPDDGSIVKPDVVLYGEQLDMGVVEGAIYEISQADLMVIVGTSLGVYPAASLIDYFNGKQVVVINQSTISTRHPDTLFLRGDMNDVFQKLM